MERKDKPKKTKVKDIDNEVIERQIDDWETQFTDNNYRGKEMIDFISCGKQWGNGVSSGRRNNNKESVTLNICRKELNKLLADYSKIGYSLDVHPTTREAKNNVEETNTFSVLMSNILLSNEIIAAKADAFSKSAQFGYSFGEINYQRINDKDLSLYPVYISHKDPRIGFFDLNALKHTKIDGRFCGMKRKLSRGQLLKKIPEISEKKCNVTDTDNVVVDYWFRGEEEVDYCLLLSGIYKRQDMLTFEDKNNIMTSERLRILKRLGQIDKDFEIETSGTIDKIYFKRICNWVNIESPVLFPTFDLPLLYHGAFTIWTPDKPMFTIPFGYELKGLQRLLNFVNSQIATQVKNASSTKWFFKPEHVLTQQQQADASEINKKEGAFTFGGNPAEIVRHDSANISPTLIQMSQSLKMISDDITGAVINPQENQMGAMSGAAIKRVINTLRDMNKNALKIDEMYFNDLGKLIGQMLPQIVTEERVMLIKKLDGSSDALVVNEATGTGEIRNNIKDIGNKFEYEIKAGLDEEDQRQETIETLKGIYALNPQLLNDTADVYFRNSNCKDSAELSRRAAVKIDPSLIKYSQGEITIEEYNNAQQQKQQQQQQQAQKQLELNPDYQSAVAMSQAEHKKADAQQKNADTKRIETLGDVINKEHQNDIKLVDILMKNDKVDAKHALETVKQNMALNDQMIDRMREVIGDNDMALQGDTEPGSPNAKGGMNPPQQEEGQNNAAEQSIPAETDA